MATNPIKMLFKSDKERDLLKDIEEMFVEAKDYRSQFEDEWDEYERFYDGRHWPYDIDTKPVNNWVFSLIETQLPVLTDARPGTDVVAIEDENLDRATVLKEAINYVYYKNNLDIKMMQSIRTSLKVGNGYLYVGYDYDKNNGKGEVVIKSLPWRWVYLDPSAGEINDSSYCIIRIPMKVDNIKRLFPQKAVDVTPEDVELDRNEENEFFRDPTRDTFLSSKNGGPGNFRPTDMAYLYEVWKKDYTMEKIPEEETVEQANEELQMILNGMPPDIDKFMDHELLMELLKQYRQRYIDGVLDEPDQESQMLIAEEAEGDELSQVILTLFDDTIAQHDYMLALNAKGERPKYKGFMRVIVKANDIVLYDGDPPTDDGLYPIAPIYAYKEEEKPYAFGEVKNIISAQKLYNDLHYAEYKSLLLNSNPGWIKDDNSGVDEDSLTNEQGIVVTKRAGTEVRRLEPGTTSPQLGNKQEVLKNDIESLSGINRPLQGQSPGGLSGRAIDLLQQQSIARVRQKSRNIEYTMVLLGQLTLSRIFQFWSTQKVLSVYDDNGRLKNMTFNPEEYEASLFEVRVSPGTTFGLPKEAILENTTNLVDRGIITPKTYVKLNDFPYKNTILSDIEEQEQLTQALQAAQMENEQLKNTLTQLTGETGQPNMAPAGNPQQGPQG